MSAESPEVKTLSCGSPEARLPKNALKQGLSSARTFAEVQVGRRKTCKCAWIATGLPLGDRSDRSDHFWLRARPQSSTAALGTFRAKASRTLKMPGLNLTFQVWTSWLFRNFFLLLKKSCLLAVASASFFVSTLFALSLSAHTYPTDRELIVWTRGIPLIRNSP